MDRELKRLNEHLGHNIISSFTTIDPSSLAAKERDNFFDSLYQLHSEIFDGVEKDEFVSYVIDSPADYTRIRIYKNKRQEWIGYCAVHRFNKPVSDRPLTIFRAEAGILREYRGSNQTLWFAFREAIKYRIVHPFCDIYYLGSFVHPSVLYMLSRYFGKCYPAANKPLPDVTKELMLELASIFGLAPVEKQNALVRKVGWITKESAEDRNFWQNHTNEVVKFYIQTNPGYVNGNGLLTLVPLTFGNISISLVNFIKNKLIRHFFDDYSLIPRAIKKTF